MAFGVDKNLYGDICHLSYDKLFILHSEVTFMRTDELKRRMAKTPEERFLNMLEQDFAYPPKIAKAILDEARNCLLGRMEHMRPGQMRVVLVKRAAPHGRPLRETEKVEVVWTIAAGQEDLAVIKGANLQRLRQVRIQRLLDEALAQGAAATQEDLAAALQVSLRTIKRDCAELKAQGIYLPTRGNLQGIGRGQTHKAQIVGRWLSGETYDQITFHTHHSQSSVQRYVQMFVRVVNLHEEGFKSEEIALLLQTGQPLIVEYLAIYRQHDTPWVRRRLAEQRRRLGRRITVAKKGAS